jgi:hypothetical protein
MNPVYIATAFIAIALVITMLQDNVDDDNDGPGGGMLQPAYAPTPS